MTANAHHTGQAATAPQETEADLALEAFFAPARSTPVLPDPLMARILEDAARVSGTQLAPVLAQPEPRGGLFASFLAAIGGWPAFGGMAAATIAGIWLGFTSPLVLDPAGFGGESYTLSDFMPAVDLAMADLDWTE